MTKTAVAVNKDRVLIIDSVEYSNAMDRQAVIKRKAELEAEIALINSAIAEMNKMV